MWRFTLPSQSHGYGDAQIDDYGAATKRRWRRGHYPWSVGVRLSLRARFSHSASQLKGTAGFGFWNAPFGDPTVPLPTLPQAAWFFFASPPSDLPLALKGAGQGWFASTVGVTAKTAVLLAPVSPIILLLNQIPAVRQRLWPWLRRWCRVSFAPVEPEMTAWHQYEMVWARAGCQFWVDGVLMHETKHSPQGALGFVCWLDNQYMVLRPNGRFGWGTLVTEAEQWLEVADLKIAQNL